MTQHYGLSRDEYRKRLIAMHRRAQRAEAALDRECDRWSKERKRLQGILRQVSYGLGRPAPDGREGA